MGTVKGLMGKGRAACLAAVAAVAALWSETATAQLTLPDPGVDVAEYVPLMITALGSVVAVVIGGYVAFKVVKLGVRWLTKAGG